MPEVEERDWEALRCEVEAEKSSGKPLLGGACESGERTGRKRVYEVGFGPGVKVESARVEGSSVHVQVKTLKADPPQVEVKENVPVIADEFDFAVGCSLSVLSAMLILLGLV
jgi:Fe2+ transport system protein FeoA